MWTRRKVGLVAGVLLWGLSGVAGAVPVDIPRNLDPNYPPWEINRVLAQAHTDIAEAMWIIYGLTNRMNQMQRICEMTPAGGTNYDFYLAGFTYNLMRLMIELQEAKNSVFWRLRDVHGGSGPNWRTCTEVVDRKLVLKNPLPNECNFTPKPDCDY